MDFSGLNEGSSDTELIAYCMDPPASQVLSNPIASTKVIRISDSAVVKTGWGVTREEAENQRRVYELVDQSIVRIPRVYRFFNDGFDVSTQLGYIIMEYIRGNVIDPLEDPAYIKKIAYVLKYFATLHGKVPGALSRGPCHGLLWEEAKEDLVFDSTSAMEKWLNSRLFEGQTINLKDCNLVLCHLDIAPRNLIWMEDGSLCIIDWASAGYYPRSFEFCAQLIFEGREGEFNRLILDSMEALSARELAQVNPFRRVWHNCQRYSFAKERGLRRKDIDNPTAHELLPLPPVVLYRLHHLGSSYN